MNRALTSEEIGYLRSLDKSRLIAGRKGSVNEAYSTEELETIIKKFGFGVTGMSKNARINKILQMISQAE